MKTRKNQSTSIRIAKGYLFIILIGTLLLMLPFATQQDEYGNVFQRIFNSLFTATSATCVTGLTLVNTGVYWSFFGQVVILIMIQIGGLGFMLVIYLLAMLVRRKITLHERKELMQAQGFMKIGGIVQLLKKIFLFALTFEVIGMLLLMIRFIPEYGVTKGIWYSVFTSVSAFCNAGFDVFGGNSLLAYQGDVLVSLTLTFLIICGGLGFIVWDNLLKNKFRFKTLMLHAKIVLITTLALLIIPTGLFLIFEYNKAFADYSFGGKILAAFFQSTTCRTAGFATVDQALLSDPSIALSTILMFIGGSSGSTAGGIKTTTFAVLLLSILSTTTKRTNIVVGKKQLDTTITKHAAAVFVFYLFMLCASTLIISGIEQDNVVVGFRDVIFEITSAIGTVGLTSAGTANFLLASQIILVPLMFVGRIGALSMIAIFREKAEAESDIIQKPTAKIVIG